MSYLLDTNVCIEFLRGRKPGITSDPGRPAHGFDLARNEFLLQAHTGLYVIYSRLAAPGNAV